MTMILGYGMQVSALGLLAMVWAGFSIAPAQAQSSLVLAYPPDNHQTQADRIFFIGAADPSGPVTLNGSPLTLNAEGYFAPSFPLEDGENRFVIRQGSHEIIRQITRLPTEPPVLTQLGFGENSLIPQAPQARQPGEWLCFGAIAPPDAQVQVQFRGSPTLPPLTLSEGNRVDLPSNLSVLIQANQPQPRSGRGQYQGCYQVSQVGHWQPVYQLQFQGQTLELAAPGTIEILPSQPIEVARVTVPSGVARTGPSSDYSRLTPLPQGTEARITGRDGDWLRLDYGGWIQAKETETVSRSTLPQTHLRSVLSRILEGWTEIVFPLQTPVPITIAQDDQTLTLTLHNTIAQTDTIYLKSDPLIRHLNWQQITPTQVQYTIHFKTLQQWGYQVRYDQNQLVLALKHPPTQNSSLRGVHIFLDPGHGSENDLGARGPTGYPEKDVTLRVSQLLRDQLETRGAIVSMSREGDEDLWPQDRINLIEAASPDLILSLHYNALPDAGDALQTQGIGTFWYYPQSQTLAQFLHDYLTQTLNRPSYGVFWNNLALTRPTIAPAVLLELGFMINPDEFTWIMDDMAQKTLVETLANGLDRWYQTQNP